ncbi:hypothetical protein NOF55_22305 [Rhizobiaceae bacterium BDR2-2]|uniref:Alpha/beta hydrolase n=1 Tax=Ectorhizobium quercum TaxID=2965071 RepID=A0AAE3N5V9_9HYPH|nr:hypothetical protein [Ectorhizobium quercum]MCX8999840.1 hypothetical protein [Ectorhizobium quercum]
MMIKTIAAVFSLALGVTLPAIAQAQAAPPKTAFVKLGTGVPAVLYEPANPGDKSAIAVFVMHAGGDYLQFSACTELSQRGYRVLCANNSTGKSGSGSDIGIDKMLIEAKLGVDYLRNRGDVRKVVLLGHSGGGALMAAYQNIAENGLKACQGPEKILKCPDSVAGLTPADGLMLVDANYGLGGMVLFSLDPAVVDEASGQAFNPDFDLFDPKNGFDAEGSHYSRDFVASFQKAVGQRNTRLIDAALARLAAIESGHGRFADDEPFTVPGANYSAPNNKLYAQDISLLSHTSKPRPLLHKDGSSTTEIVRSVRVPQNTALMTRSFREGALRTTVKTFLSTYSVRVGPDFSYDADSIRGVDWQSSYTTPIGSVQKISAPLLAMGMTAGWEYLAAEMIYENAASADKSIAFVEGAGHLYTTCKECEKTEGAFGDTLKTTYDHIDRWLAAPGRF